MVVPVAIFIQEAERKIIPAGHSPMGQGVFVGLLLCSVSQQCVSHATCPVLVQPRDDGG